MGKGQGRGRLPSGANRPGPPRTVSLGTANRYPVDDILHSPSANRQPGQNPPLRLPRPSSALPTRRRPPAGLAGRVWALGRRRHPPPPSGTPSRGPLCAEDAAAATTPFPSNARPCESDQSPEVGAPKGDPSPTSSRAPAVARSGCGWPKIAR